MLKCHKNMWPSKRTGLLLPQHNSGLKSEASGLVNILEKSDLNARNWRAPFHKWQLSQDPLDEIQLRSLFLCWSISLRPFLHHVGLWRKINNYKGLENKSQEQKCSSCNFEITIHATIYFFIHTWSKSVNSSSKSKTELDALILEGPGLWICHLPFLKVANRLFLVKKTVS